MGLAAHPGLALNELRRARAEPLAVGLPDSIVFGVHKLLRNLSKRKHLVLTLVREKKQEDSLENIAATHSPFSTVYSPTAVDGPTITLYRTSLPQYL